jgi:hypothetical protein
MAVYVDKNNPQTIVISSRDANGDLQEVGTVSVAYTVVANKEVATLAIVPTPTVATLGGTTAAVTLTLA